MVYILATPRSMSSTARLMPCRTKNAPSESLMTGSGSIANGTPWRRTVRLMLDTSARLEPQTARSKSVFTLGSKTIRSSDTSAFQKTMRSDNPKNNKNVMESLKNNKNVATSDLSESAGSACIGIYDDFDAAEISQQPRSVRLAWSYGRMLRCENGKSNIL